MKIIIASMKGMFVFPFLGYEHDISADIRTMPQDEQRLFLGFTINEMARLLIETVQSENSDLNTIALVANRYAQLSQSPKEYEAESEYLVLEVNMEPDICKWSMVIPFETVGTDEEALSLVRTHYNAMYN